SPVQQALTTNLLRLYRPRADAFGRYFYAVFTKRQKVLQPLRLQDFCIAIRWKGITSRRAN
ncbi:MAG: hypothetical protein ACI3XJ_08940, partial [Oscillospiraceae bacterium]